VTRRFVRAARVITATSRGTIDDGVVEIDGDRIVDVVPAHEFGDALAGAAVEHYPEATLLPGLVDAHAHLTLAADRRHLASGVTTLRDNGGRNRTTFIVREAINRGYFVGPRLLLSGRPITHRYGHFFWCNGEANGADEIRATVRQLVAEGADHIKIMASGGGTAGNIPYYPSYTADELRVAVDAAHALGRLTTAHCRARQSMVNAVDAGLDCIEHAEFLVPGPIADSDDVFPASGVMQYEPRVTERLLEAGTFVSYTFQAGGCHSLVELRAKAEHERLSASEERRRSELERYFEVKIDIARRLLGDGLLPRFVISTDAGPFDTEFGRLDLGLVLGVEAGLTPLQAIEAATRVAAAACGVERIVGSLAAGKQADLCVVSGDPLADIRAIGDVRAVYRAGRRLGPRADGWLPWASSAA
jgi:imidazolonepropionase-like amidohydrolase